MREALRQEHANNEQQNLARVAENLELTKELNLLRKKNAGLGAQVTRLEAKIKVGPDCGCFLPLVVYWTASESTGRCLLSRYRLDVDATTWRW